MRSHRVLLLFYLTAGMWSFPSIVIGQGVWVAPRTPEGKPDLQGVWLSNAAIPMERPSSLAGRPRLTDEEVATLQERTERIFRNGRSAFATPEGAFRAAFDDIETYDAWSTSSSIGMVDVAVTNQTSLVIDPPDGHIPMQTAGGRLREQAVVDRWRFKTGPEDLNNFHRCITTGVPRLGGNFGAGPYTYYQIFQTSEYFVFFNEAFHDARIIPLDRRAHLPEQIRQWNGNSRGYWDDETLVIETRNFSKQSYYRGSTDRLVLVERFTRSGPDTLTYHLTFSDPTTWASSWSAETPLSRRDEPLYEFACHEGNVSMVGMLRTARLEDSAANSQSPE